MMLPTLKAPIPVWSIKAENGIEVTGQFAISDGGLTEDVGTNWETFGGFARPWEMLEWSHGVNGRFQFEAMFYEVPTLLFTSGGIGMSGPIIEALDNLRKLCQKDDALMRPPICQFTWGSEISAQVVVDSICGIKYGELRPDGTLRWFSCQLTLLKYYAPGTSSTGETLYRFAKARDTYETIARDVYKNPILGVNLRRLAPSKPDLTAGDIVKVPNQRKPYIRESVAPASVVFSQVDKVKRLHEFSKRRAY